MLAENREFHYAGELNLKMSHVLVGNSQPGDDTVNWLFLNAGNMQFSFVYKILDPLKARFDRPFKADLAFTMIEAAKQTVRLHQAYEVLRGQEVIGTVKLTSAY